MTNPFGISDEMMNCIIAMVMKQQQEQKKVTPSENLFKINLDIEKEAEKSAKITKALYDTFVKVGFTEVQAFEIIKNIITAKKN